MLLVSGETIAASGSTLYLSCLCLSAFISPCMLAAMAVLPPVESPYMAVPYFSGNGWWWQGGPCSTCPERPVSQARPQSCASPYQLACNQEPQLLQLLLPSQGQCFSNHNYPLIKFHKGTLHYDMSMMLQLTRTSWSSHYNMADWGAARWAYCQQDLRLQQSVCINDGQDVVTSPLC